MGTFSKVVWVLASLGWSSGAASTPVPEKVIQLATGDQGIFIDMKAPGGGLMPVLVRKVFEDMGYKITIVHQPLRRALKSAEEPPFAGTFPWLISPERKANFYVSDPLISYTLGTYVLKGSPIQRIEKDRAHEFSTCDMDGSLLKQYLPTDVKWKIVYVNAPAQCHAMMAKGRIQYMLTPEPMIGKLDRKTYRIVPNDFNIQLSVHLFLHKSYPNAQEIMTEFNRVLRAHR